jgi:hypothetical protein
MLLVRQKMGAHKTYGQFRGAKEIMEMLDLDPEENADAKTRDIFKALVWRVGKAVVMQRDASSHESSSVVPGPTAEVELLRAEVKGLNADVERLTMQVKANMNAQATTMEALKQQNALFLANLDPGKRKEVETRIETMSTDGPARSLATAPPRRNKKDKNKTNSSSKYSLSLPPPLLLSANGSFSPLFALAVPALISISPICFSLFHCPTFLLDFCLYLLDLHFSKMFIFLRVTKVSERMDDDETSKIFSNWGQLSKTISSKIKR